MIDYDLRKVAEERGDRWRAIRAKLEKQHAREQESLRVKHLQEDRETYQEFRRNETLRDA